jgi:Tfp pilus assembly protein PilF
MPEPQGLTAQELTALGVASVQSGNTARGVELLGAAWRLNRADRATACNFAQVLIDTKQPYYAMAVLRAASVLVTPDAHMLSTIGMALHGIGDAEEAMEKFDASIASTQEHTFSTLMNAAYFAQSSGDAKKAESLYCKAKDLEPLNLNAKLSWAMAKMCIAETKQEMLTAMETYECRRLMHKTDSLEGVPFLEDIGQLNVNHRVAIIAEQGLGDTVMCLRYAMNLNASGAQVLLVGNPGVQQVGRRVLGVAEAREEDASRCDFQVNAMSLPLLFSRHIGVDFRAMGSSPYVHAKKMVRSHPNAPIRVGLCWQGSRKHPNDKYRSIKPEILAAAFTELACKRVKIVSLQVREENIGMLANDLISFPIIDCVGDLLREIEGVDVVVSVDSAPAHIAGAMGKPMIMLVAPGCDWRWGAEGDKTPLYPSMTIIRAKEPLVWAEAVERAAAEFRNVANVLVGADLESAGE